MQKGIIRKGGGPKQHLQRHKPDKHMIREAAARPKAGQSYRLMRRVECGDVYFSSTVCIVKWDGRGKGEAINKIYRDTNL